MIVLDNYSYIYISIYIYILVNLEYMSLTVSNSSAIYLGIISLQKKQNIISSEGEQGSVARDVFLDFANRVQLQPPAPNEKMTNK